VLVLGHQDALRFVSQQSSNSSKNILCCHGPCAVTGASKIAHSTVHAVAYRTGYVTCGLEPHRLFHGRNAISVDFCSQKAYNNDMRFNINEEVKVRLTVAGHQVYEKHTIARNVELRKYGIRINLGEEHPEDTNGWSRWQMWELMTIFGPHMGVGSIPMFDTEIIIPEKSLTPGE